MADFHPATTSIDVLVDVLIKFRSQSVLLEQCGIAIIDSLKRGGKIMTCGNGGSAADALHMAEEFVGRFRKNRRSLPAVCLCADVTSLTCIANDFGYDFVFSRSVEALGSRGDVLVSFSTSGNSPNVKRAMLAAKQSDILNILVTGSSGGEAAGFADFAILVPSNDTARIQEVHTFVLHHWLEMVECQEWGQRG